MRQIFGIISFFGSFLVTFSAGAFPVVQQSGQFNLVEFNWQSSTVPNDGISIEGLNFITKQDSENYLQTKANLKKSVNIEEAEKLFSFLKAQADIPYDMPQDGCYARAHVMARLLEANGVDSRKAFIFGVLIVDSIYSRTGILRWNFHVAPLIQVEINGGIEDRILDPSIMSGPATPEEWFTKMRNENCQVTGACQLRVANKYTYQPPDIDLDNTGWDLKKWTMASDYILKYRDMVKNFKGPHLPSRPR